MARVGERPQRVAGDEQVAEHPHERRGGRERGQAHDLAARAPPPCGRLWRVPRRGLVATTAARPAGHEVHQVQPVERGEGPRLGAQQPGEGEQDEHGHPGGALVRAPVARLHEQGSEHEQQVGDVDVGAHAVGEDGDAREEDERGERAGGAAEPFGAEPVDDPAAGGQGEEGERDGDGFDGVRAERGEHEAEGLDERVGGGGDGDVVGGGAAPRELPAPRERVERVVVGEADAGEDAQQHGSDGDRGGRPPAPERGGHGADATVRGDDRVHRRAAGRLS